MQRRFIRINELASTRDRAGRWPVAPATVWRWVAAGLLDAPVRLGPQVSAWPVEVIEAHEQAQALVVASKEQRVKAGVASVAARRAKRETEAAR